MFLVVSGNFTRSICYVLFNYRTVLLKEVFVSHYGPLVYIGSKCTEVAAARHPK